MPGLPPSSLTARVLVVALVAAALVAPRRVRAQAPNSGAAPVRLAELYSQIERNNPRVGAAYAFARAAHARVPATTRLPDPQFQLGFMNYSLPSIAPMSTIGMAQVQVMQTVPLGGKLSLAGRAADAQAAAADERANETIWELRNQAAAGFYDLYAIDGQLSVARETLRLLQDIARTAESLYRVGDGRQVDVIRAQVEMARMVEDTLRMHALRTGVAARMNALLNRDAQCPIGSAEAPRFPEALPVQSSLDSLAWSSRPIIRAGMQNVNAASASAAGARKEIFPDLEIGAQLAQRGGEHMGSLMIGASLPIFARDRQLQMRREADAMKTMADAELTSMRAETRASIAEAYADLVRARDLQRLYSTTAIPQAQAAVASALASYRVGRLEFSALLEGQMTVNKFRQEQFTLVADEGKAWAELEMLTGRSLVDVQGRDVSASAERERTQR